ncbi:hypothetical protein DPSP01_013105 [Paraphaeosphaeria sporulosa]|uniref:Uncharacterized protein n=1 Tax=Paraphaeosphaeria sporulosa TaxID=1460663 RepID=A0A177CZQ3_9PLEO|nr:uncharacterized protein CC84DRAFT_1211948 [Paraphaeosphaeria sporulosa]OAG12382.1 hypothetical protein CC84DRAFT_1211948 [Paraphaeosphaeria sporulosa]
MTTPAANSHARKRAMPPTSPSGKPVPSSPALLAQANPVPGSPTSELQTPRERRSISNRFWEKNGSRAKDGTSGVDLASDSSDPDDDSEAARIKKHDHLHTKVKRLLALETTGAIRLKTLESNKTVREYNKLLDAFAHKPKTKRKRAQCTETLRLFLEDHDQIIDLYNQYAILDHGLHKDRILPEFMRDDDRSASAKKIEQAQASNVRRAPAKHALNKEDDSDEEGVVLQTVKSGEGFDEPSVFNTRGLTVPSIFNRKTSATVEKDQRRFLLHRRDGPLTRDAEGDQHVLDERTAGDQEETPTRPPTKKRRLG